jgi:hypothetical protein
MRAVLILISLIIVSACATDDTISERKYGQQLVCHKGHTQAVSAADSFGHQNHGDTLGPCPKDQ